MTIKKLWNNIYVRNITYAVMVVLLLIFLSNIFLSLYTRHGKSSPVPDFKGKTMDSVLLIAKANHLRIEVADSVFRLDYPKGSVFEQNPAAGLPVKKNRKIFLTLNSLEPRKEASPNVVGMSLRQAKAELGSKGFRIGTLNYVSDIATNNVLQQSFNGQTLTPGVLLTVGSEVDLKVGLDSSNLERARVPSVTGMALNDARDMLIENSLNNKLIFDKSVRNITDSLNATVYKQDPEKGSSAAFGGVVTLYLKK